MKMKLSKYYWIHLYGMVGLGIISEFGLFYFFKGCSNEDFILYLFCMISCTLIFSFVALLPWKYLMTMEIKENMMKSFLFGQLKCEVYTEQTIYYALFKCRETNTNSKTYIAISNGWFIYDEPKGNIWSRKTFFDYYDRTKQIVFPYDKKTKHLFPIENWTRVN